jgi:Sulfatase
MKSHLIKQKLGLYFFAALLAVGYLWSSVTQSHAQVQKPNFLLIMGDDIGYWNISAYNRGQMGYRTPNIDRIANEGAIFTDYYGQQSCTAGAYACPFAPIADSPGRRPGSPLANDAT